MSKVASRQDTLLQLLATAERITVAEICVQLGASPATVRRDLEHLEGQGLVIRTHGGATLRQQSTLLKPPYMERLQRNNSEKLAIARVALGLIRDHDTVFVSSGTTTYHLARLLAESDREVTVVTNAVDLAVELSHGRRLRTIVLGGEVGDSYGVSGEWAATMLARLPQADHTFVGADGISLEHGITTYRPLDAEIHKQLAERARRTIVLADHTKFGVVRFCQMLDFRAVGQIITDDGLPAEVAVQYRAAGLQLELAPVER